MTGADNRFGPGGVREGREINWVDPKLRRRSPFKREPLHERLEKAKVMLAGTVYSDLFDEASREIATLQRALRPGFFSRVITSIRARFGK